MQNNKKEPCIEEKRDKNADQFEYINTTSLIFIKNNQPVIFLNTNKKELIYNSAHDEQVNSSKKTSHLSVDDFPVDSMIKVAPYGTYIANEKIAFVNLGNNHTGDFTVESISRWWDIVGKHTFPNTHKLFIVCDWNRSSEDFYEFWTSGLQQFANRTDLELHISHIPRGYWKWSNIEHKLVCFILKKCTNNLFIEIETVVSLINNNNKNNKNLKVTCLSDKCVDLTIKNIDDDFETVNILKIMPYGNWNYTISPRK
ncbi:MAG: hypothetical protein FWH37_10000 [Candidatus Bathyarchaeota archaeon]|nr:hypothetical protein [Candidatus Termiticorpusculum sp.]